MSLVKYKKQADIHAARIQTRFQKHGRLFTYADIVAFVLEHIDDYPAIYFRTTKGPILAVDEDKAQAVLYREPGCCAYCGQVVCRNYLPAKRQLPNPEKDMIQEKVKICSNCLLLYDDSQGEMSFQHIKLYILCSVLFSISTLDEAHKNTLEHVIKQCLLGFNSKNAFNILCYSLMCECSISLLFFLHPQVIIELQYDPILALKVISCLMAANTDEAQELTQALTINQIDYIETVGAEQYTLQQLMTVDAAIFADIIQTLWQQDPCENLRIRKILHILLCLRAYQQCGTLYGSSSQPVLDMQHELRLCLAGNSLTSKVKDYFSNIAQTDNMNTLQHSCCQWLLAHPDCDPNTWVNANYEPWLWRLAELLHSESYMENLENLAVFTTVLARADYNPNHLTELDTFLLYKLLSLPGELGLRYFQRFIDRKDVNVNLLLEEYSMLTLLLGPYMDFDRRGAYDFTLQKLHLLLEKGADTNVFTSIISIASNDFLLFLYFIVEAIEFASQHVEQNVTNVTVDMITSDYPQLSQLTEDEKAKLVRQGSIKMFASEDISAWQEIISRCESSA